MIRRSWILAVVAVVAILALSFPGAPAADGVDRVQVTNFPEVQSVRGTVRVPEPIPQAQLHRVTEVVGPVDREEIVHLVDGGIVETAGWGSVVLSLVGSVKGPLSKDGRVGAILVPAVEEIERARVEDSRLLLPVEVAAPVSPAGGGLFAAQTAPLPLGFPRYRLLLYNDSERTVEATVYAYLVNG